MNILKRISLVIMLVVVGVVTASAENIECAWSSIKALPEFSTMKQTSEAAKATGFDSMEVGLSETVTPAVVRRVGEILSALPQTEQQVALNNGEANVWIYARALSGDKSLALIVVTNGKEGAVIYGVCPKSMIDNQFNGFHFNNLFSR